MGESIRDAAAEGRLSLNVPLLLTHGTADVMTSYEASRQFVEALACPDKTFKSYPDAYHNCAISVYCPVNILYSAL